MAAIYSPTSTHGRTLYGVRLMFAASATFQSLCSAGTMDGAALRVTFEDPFEKSEDEASGRYDLPKIYILSATHIKGMISGGSNPHLFPAGSDIIALLKFWPNRRFHDIEHGAEEFFWANDIAGKIADEVGGESINGADVTFDGSTVALPSVENIEIEPYDSRVDGIEDVTDGDRNYRYYNCCLYRLRVKP